MNSFGSPSIPPNQLMFSDPAPARRLTRLENEAGSGLPFVTLTTRLRIVGATIEEAG
ncbi:hypothetical protein ONA70_02665 [Micromonospora yasonensis]|uniref:hypothetical protein n=1 Tax=Micromonospora yasonensis TaxID=1128667 RepID=UPI0022302029|nr:hypothetical protein [Micromonospora yasonensis]MCW3838999.1 hypothetical protein [Micromonospora yasonensis]